MHQGPTEVPPTHWCGTDIQWCDHSYSAFTKAVREARTDPNLQGAQKLGRWRTSPINPKATLTEVLPPPREVTRKGGLPRELNRNWLEWTRHRNTGAEGERPLSSKIQEVVYGWPMTPLTRNSRPLDSALSRGADLCALLHANSCRQCEGTLDPRCYGATVVWYARYGVTLPLKEDPLRNRGRSAASSRMPTRPQQDYSPISATHEFDLRASTEKDLQTGLLESAVTAGVIHPRFNAPRTKLRPAMSVAAIKNALEGKMTSTGSAFGLIQQDSSLVTEKIRWVLDARTAGLNT